MCLFVYKADKVCTLIMSESIFTKIKNKEIPGNIIYEDDKCFALEDINPQAPVHILIIPHKEITKINNRSRTTLAFVGNYECNNLYPRTYT